MHNLRKAFRKQVSRQENQYPNTYQTILDQSLLPPNGLPVVNDHVQQMEYTKGMDNSALYTRTHLDDALRIRQNRGCKYTG